MLECVETYTQKGEIESNVPYAEMKVAQLNAI